MNRQPDPTDALMQSLAERIQAFEAILKEEYDLKILRFSVNYWNSSGSSKSKSLQDGVRKGKYESRRLKFEFEAEDHS